VGFIFCNLNLKVKVFSVLNRFKGKRKKEKGKREK